MPELEGLRGLGEFIESLAELAPIFIFFAILIAIVFVIIEFIGSFGIMKLAKKNNIPYAWLAFIPGAKNYLIGKLGFEIYAADDKKNTTIPWVILGLDIIIIVGYNVSAIESIVSLVSTTLTILTIMAYYQIYKYLTPEYKKYTILSYFFGGIPLLMNKDLLKARDDNNISNSASAIGEMNNMYQNHANETVAPVRNLYCSNCGNQLEANARFCGKCGKQIN